MSTAIKPKKTTFKHVEAEWYNYHITLREIARLRLEIMNPFDEQPEQVNIVKGANSVREPGNPTERIATRLTTNKRLSHLTEVTDAIEQVYQALPENYKQLVKLKYWNKGKSLSWTEIAFQLHVVPKTAQRWRDSIVHTTIDVLGWR